MDATTTPQPTTPHPGPLPRVAALVVTFNRKGDLDRCLRAILAQTYPAARLDVVIVDNASTDGTGDHVLQAWRPERVVANAAERADVPAFNLGRGATGGNAGRWKSLTLVRNQHNLGGCGGFNTALLMVERTIAAHRAESMVPEDPRLNKAEPLEYVWLIDDDAIPEPECLERLVRAAQDDPTIGIAGARMVDPADPRVTVSSAIFFNPSTGLFGAPEPGHPMKPAYDAWLERAGDAKGRHESARAKAAMTEVLDVECVAACSMLARWSVARRLGYWDARFFISGDDADWCLRFKRAGHRVVSVLGAVVRHVPCTRKQNVVQDYHRRRNLFWIWERSLPPADLRRLVKARVRLIMGQAWSASWHGRGLEASMILRSAIDAATGRGGRLDLADRRARETTPLRDAIAGVLGGKGGLAVVCPSARMTRRALRLRHEATRLGLKPDWMLLVHAGSVSPALRARLEREGVKVVEYGLDRRSKVSAQRGLALRPPAAWVVMDGRTDLPLIRPSRVLHVEVRPTSRGGSVARLERFRPGQRAWFVLTWIVARLRTAWYAARVMPREFEGKFGTLAARAS